MKTPFTTIKVRVDSANDRHVRVTMFTGETGHTLANAGQLCLNTGEYQLFSVALSMGAEQMQNHLSVVHEDAEFKLWTQRHTAGTKGPT